MSKLLIIVAFIIINSITVNVMADLPIHCLHAQVAGTWEFEMTLASHDSPDLCGYRQPDKSRYHFDNSNKFVFKPHKKEVYSLLSPNKVESKNGEGTWTMVYDEGFSVKVKNSEFFAFHAYKPKKGTLLSDNKAENYISFCDQTLVGWYRDLNNKWGCWRGKQIKRQHNHEIAASSKTKDEVEEAVVSPTASTKDDLDQLFDPNYSFIEMINSDESSLWTAKVHEPFLSKTMREMLQLTGANEFDKNIFDSAFETSNFLEINNSITKSDDLNKSQDINDPYYVSLLETMESNNSEEKICEYGLPCSLDWRNHNGHNWLSNIRNQGSCGSCYAMAFASVLESRKRIADKNPSGQRYSAQHVLSCSVYNQGCDGGYPFLVGKHMEHFGAVSEKCFPYEAMDSMCMRSCKDVEFPVYDTHYVGGYYGACNEEAIMREIAEGGPVVIAFEAPRELFSYHGGIFSGKPARREKNSVDKVNDWQHTNHAVVAVGWGHAMVKGKRVKYWIMRNTWGKTWGENGYFRIIRGENNCSIESMAVSFHIKK